MAHKEVEKREKTLLGPKDKKKGSPFDTEKTGYQRDQTEEDFTDPWGGRSQTNGEKRFKG